MASSKADWKSLVAKKQADGQAKVPAQWKLKSNLIDSIPKNAVGGRNFLEEDIPRKSGILSEQELKITEQYTASQLLGLLASGDLSSTLVTSAFCKRAAMAQQLMSCLTETLYDQALQRAKYLDEYLAKEGKVVGPLHGLPISIKDSFKIKGTASTIGFVAFIQNGVDDSNSGLVDQLLDLGAVLYVKTNIPHTMMTADSENNIFGRTLNPHNTAMTAGGSSGGEGALVAFRGSVLGVGTDVAGSIRIPSFCCGTYGFKPSTERVPFSNGSIPVRPGFPGIMPCAGPLANSFGDLEIFMRAILNSHPDRYDTHALPVPFLEPKRSEVLNIGVLQEDPHYPLHPPVRRALANAVAALKVAGHNVFPLSHPSISLATRIAFTTFTLDPNPVDFMAEAGEPKIKSLTGGTHPFWTGPAIAQGNLDDKLVKLHDARTEYAKSWLEVWEKADVILSPSAQSTAVKLDAFGWPPYTVVWNLLDYPAAVIPYGKSSKESDAEEVKMPARSLQPSYEPEAMDGLPCSVQVVTNKFTDEKCLWATGVIDQVLNGSGSGSVKRTSKI